jgi:hypothetical protein
MAELDQFYAAASTQNGGDSDYLTQLTQPQQLKAMTPERMAELDAYYSQNKPNKQQADEVGIGRTALDQGLQGATFGFADELTDRIGAGIASLYTGESYDSMLKNARGMSKDRMAAEFDQNPVTSIVSNLAGGLLTGGAGATTKAGTAAANSIRTGNTAARIGKASLAGAASGGIYGAGTADEGNRLEGAATGAAIGAALPVAIGAGGAAVKAGANAVTPTIQEGLLPVVQLAQKFKIPVALNQVAEGNAIKNFQKVSKELPFSGESKFRDTQLKAFNRGLIETTGGRADKFTPELMDNLFTRVGKEFDKLGAGKTFNLNNEFLDGAASILDDAASTGIPKETIAGFEKVLNRIFDNAKDGKIKGETLAIFRKEANRLARKSNNDEARNLLHDLENNIVDVMTAGDDVASGALSKAKQQYKNLLVLEPLAAKAKSGNISPSALQSRVSKIYGRQFTRGKAGDIGELARIGFELLPELGGSDTLQKGAYLVGATGALANPATIPSMIGVLGANRAAQSVINRNQSLIKGAANRTAKRIASNPQKKLP